MTFWRLAVCPTRRSPFFVNATTDGSRREPSAVVMTAGSPPSMTATTELVVPRSIPTILAIVASEYLSRYGSIVGVGRQSNVNGASDGYQRSTAGKCSGPWPCFTRPWPAAFSATDYKLLFEVDAQLFHV